MIFPANLPVVTFYLPIEDVYYEVIVSSSSTTFQLERYFDRQAISGRKVAGVRGFRFECGIRLDQSTQHSTWKDFLDGLYTEHVTNGGQYIDLYLVPQSSIGGGVTPVRVVVGEAMSQSIYTNTIARSGYSITFSGHLSETELDLGEIAFVIDNNGDFVVNSTGDFVIVEASIG